MKQSRKLYDIALSVVVAAYLLLGMAPFGFDPNKALAVKVFHLAPVDAFFNFVCFLPLGWLIARTSKPSNGLFLPSVACAALSGFVETLQLFTLGRVASLSDLLLNVTGAFSGAWLCKRGLGPRSAELPRCPLLNRS